MRYAIDIMDESIKKEIISELISLGHVVIDCSDKDSMSLGENLYKKVLLSNSIKPTYFIRFKEDLGDKDKIEFYGDESVLTNILSLDLEEIVNNLKLEQICIKSGKELYLIKNLYAICIIVRLVTKESCIKKDFISSILKNLIKSLK
ncbi:hypothetical protein [Clostridium tarantellae]|uniref:Uncharacterized protein n=1 Tax=Clostridium tarantellae TaxID=39493 RepID=A0A6I1MSY4_9CLOT|nr:hypothetical protein [Clostridium tarantellae]MPQ45277.1 hypothetical protein [Clostridium tarantellae]